MDASERRLQKATKETKVGITFEPLRCLLSFCLRFRIAIGEISRFKFSQKAAIKLGSELDLEPFVTFVSFCLRFFLMSRSAADRLDYQTRVSRLAPDSFASWLAGCSLCIS